MTKIEKQISEFFNSGLDLNLDELQQPSLGRQDYDIEIKDFRKESDYNFDVLRLKFRLHYIDGYTLYGADEVPNGQYELSGVTEAHIFADDNAIYNMALMREFEGLLTDIIKNKYNV